MLRVLAVLVPFWSFEKPSSQYALVKVFDWSLVRRVFKAWPQAAAL